MGGFTYATRSRDSVISPKPGLPPLIDDGWA